MMKRKLLRVFLACLSLGVFAQFAGCGEDAAAVTATPRTVKVERIEASGTIHVDSFAGTVRAKQRSELGFESGGRIATLTVDIGDTVRTGQVLATVDPVPAQERLRKADADRATAAASLAERDAQLRRVRQLQHDEVVAEAVLEDARLQRDGAAAQLTAAEACMALARRELAMSRIVAPFDGRIVTRTAQPSMNVAPGQAVLEIEGNGAREVVAFLPGQLAERMKTGDKAIIRITEATQRVVARLDKLSGHADNGSLVQAIFRVEGDTSSMRPGTAVLLDLRGEATTAMTAPTSALLPDAQAGQGGVFIFDAAQKRVALRKVQIETGLARDGRVSVSAGLQPGEWVVVAGPAFLTDGQAATAFEAQTRLSDARP